MISKKSQDIFNTFGAYQQKHDKASKEKRDNFTREDLEFALIQYHIDRGNPIYRAVEDRINELERIERLTRDKKEKWKDWIIVFFITLAVCLIGITIEKCVFLAK
jgi:hypothetical protein